MSVFTEPATLSQIAILAIGIYLLLSFLRSTRGSGLVRGLGLTLIVGVYGLWWASSQFQLFELRHIIEGLLGFVFVILAIIFQPELRRGIVSLGENPLLGRFLKAHRKEVLAEVAASAVVMAKKKQGALIAFERKTPLDAYIEGAVKLDCEVNRYLLDSLFHHGNALHDGAVIIRGDRIVAAASLFPLTDNIEISKSTGTRHRAALGVTEETDAITVAVSEETGYISICQRGKIERRIPRAQLEEVLRERIGAGESNATTQDTEESAVEQPPWLVRLVTQHVGQKFAALVLAGLVFYGAHLDIIVSKEVNLQIVGVESSQGSALRDGTLRVVVPSEYRLGQGTSLTCNVAFRGTREQLDVLKTGVSGQVSLEPGLPDQELRLDIANVHWGSLTLEEGVQIRWVDEPPLLEIENLGDTTVTLRPGMVQVLADDLDDRYEADVESIRFIPSAIHIRGPQADVEALRQVIDWTPDPAQTNQTPPPPILAAIRLGADDQGLHAVRGALAPRFVARGLTLEDEFSIQVPIRPRVVEVGTSIVFPISLQSFTSNGEALRRFQPPSETAQIRILTRGLVSGKAESDEWIADGQAIRDLVKDLLRVFVEVDHIPEGSREGTVTTTWIGNWRKKLPDVDVRFRAACDDPAAELWVELESSPVIQLETPLVEPGDDQDEQPREEGY